MSDHKVEVVMKDNIQVELSYSRLYAKYLMMEREVIRLRNLLEGQKKHSRSLEEEVAILRTEILERNMEEFHGENQQR